jgi:hypothetical protein
MSRLTVDMRKMQAKALSVCHVAATVATEPGTFREQRWCEIMPQLPRLGNHTLNSHALHVFPSAIHAAMVALPHGFMTYLTAHHIGI